MIRRAKPLLGTFVEIAIDEISAPSRESVDVAIKQAFCKIELIHQQLSFHQTQSELSKLNSQPGKWVQMSHHSMRVLRLAKLLGKVSNNAFNCTVGGELVNRGVLPNLVNHAFLSIGIWQDIEIANSSAKLHRPVLLTLDGIAKGYAVDLAVSRLRQAGMMSGWVNAGGDLKVFGESSLKINQRSANGFSQSVSFNNIALASSRFSNQIDPDFPALLITNKRNSEQSTQSEILSISAKFAWRADALTKIAASASNLDRQAKIQSLGGQCLKFNFA